MIEPHQRIDDSDTVSAPDNEGVHLEGVGVGADHTGGTSMSVRAGKYSARAASVGNAMAATS
jgi:hypothetical protein